MVGGLMPTWKYSISAYSVRERIKHHTNVMALSTFILPPYYDKVGLLAYQPTTFAAADDRMLRGEFSEVSVAETDFLYASNATYSVNLLCVA